MQLIVFSSTNLLVAADIALRAAGLSVKVIPLPTSISARCGMGLQVKDIDDAKQILTTQNIPHTVECL